MHIAEEQELLGKPVAPIHSRTPFPPNHTHKKFHVQLGLDKPVVKQKTSTIELRELAEKRLQEIPPDSAVIYTDGSSYPNGRSGSGIHAKLKNRFINKSIRNPNRTSNFTAELNAIDEALTVHLQEEAPKQAYVICDSQSAIQSTANCFQATDDIQHCIAKKIQQLPNNMELNIQWIPSHISIFGNDLADQLAKQGANDPKESTSTKVTAEDHYNHFRHQIHKEWKANTKHDWYSSTKPGETVLLKLTRQEQAALSRLRTGQLKSMIFNEQGEKTFPNCPRCNGGQSTPLHIMQCICLPPDALYYAPQTVLLRLHQYNFIGLV